MINLRSDNEVGAHPLIIEAVSRAFTSGSAFSYGADEWTRRVENRLRDIFDKPDLVVAAKVDQRETPGGKSMVPSRPPVRGSTT